MKSNNRSLDENNYLDLWSLFHTNSLNAFDKESGDVSSDIIVWSSGLTEPEIIEKHFDKKRFTVETWEKSDVLIDLVSLGYKVIMAFKDVYYLDHGFWYPTNYHNWKIIYNNKMPMVSNPELLLGGEVRIILYLAY